MYADAYCYARAGRAHAVETAVPISFQADAKGGHSLFTRCADLIRIRLIERLAPRYIGYAASASTTRSTGIGWTHLIDPSLTTAKSLPPTSSKPMRRYLPWPSARSRPNHSRSSSSWILQCAWAIHSTWRRTSCRPISGRRPPPWNEYRTAACPWCRYSLLRSRPSKARSPLLRLNYANALTP